MEIKDYQKEKLANQTTVVVNKTHRFGTDAMLLSHFCQLHYNQSACDFGTGCGIIPLRWYDMGHKGECYAVELQQQAVDLFELAIKENNITNIHIINSDIKNLNLDKKFDVVSCNPPYFKGGFVSKNQEKATQRHQLSMTTKDLCKAASAILKDNGKLCVCQRPEMLGELFSEMIKQNIQPKRLQFVKQAPDKTPWLALVDGRKNGGVSLNVLKDLIVATETGEYTQEMLKIYGKL